MRCVIVWLNEFYFTFTSLKWRDMLSPSKLATTTIVSLIHISYKAAAEPWLSVKGGGLSLSEPATFESCRHPYESLAPGRSLAKHQKSPSLYVIHLSFLQLYTVTLHVSYHMAVPRVDRVTKSSRPSICPSFRHFQVHKWRKEENPADIFADTWYWQEDCSDVDGMF